MTAAVAVRSLFSLVRCCLILGALCLNTFRSAEDYVRAAAWLLVRV